MGFKGKSVHSINESGRISLPSRIREELSSNYEEDRLVIACLADFIVAFPNKEWIKFEEKLHLTPPKSIEDANKLRRIYETLEDVIPDKQGRILISAQNREKAKLKDECVILGLYDRVEIWSKQVWDLKQTDNNMTASGEQFNLLLF